MPRSSAANGAVDVPERAEIERAKGLQPASRGLDDVARDVDLFIEHREHTLAARLGRSGDAQGIDEVMPASEPSALAGRCAPCAAPD